MITTVSGISKKLLKSNKTIIFSSLFSILLTVALIICMFSFGYNMERSFKLEMSNLYGNYDMMVGYPNNSTQTLNSGVIHNIKSVKGVSDISKVIINNTGIASADNPQIKIQGVYSVGTDNSYMAKSKYKFTKNIKSNEIVINKGLAEMLKVSVNSQVTIYGFNNSTYTCKVAEIIPDLKGSSDVPDMIITDIDFLKKADACSEDATYLMVKDSEDSMSLDVAQKIKDIDKNFRIDIIENDEFVQKNIENLKSFFILLSVLVLIMCSLFIISNFEIFLHKYRKEFAIIRLNGGSSGQAFQIVFLQALYIVIPGAISGMLLSYLANKYVSGILAHLFSIKILTLEFPWGTSVLITVLCTLLIMLFMLLPAAKSSGILPLEVMQVNEKLDFGPGKGKKILSIVLLIIGCLIIICGESNMNDGMLYGIAGGLFILFGIFMGFSYCVKPILLLISPIFRALGGNVSFVAVRNLIPQVRKNTLVLLTIASTIIITIVGSGVLFSIKSNGENQIRKEYVSDVVLTSRYNINTKLTYDFRSNIEKITAVKDLAVLSDLKGIFMLDGNNKTLLNFCFADLKELGNMKVLPVIQGNWDNKVVLSSSFAKEHNINAGDEIKVTIDHPVPKEISQYKGRIKVLKVAAVADNLPGSGSGYIDWSNTEMLDKSVRLNKVLINAKNGQKDSLIDGLKDLRSEYPELKWTTLSEAMNDFQQGYIQRWILFITVLGIIFIILIFGIINTLNNYINSKRREYAILRVISVTPSNILKTIITQVLLYLIIGIIVGTISGVIFLLALLVTSHEKFLVDFRILGYEILLILLFCIAFIIPTGLAISRKKITEELVG